MLNCHKRSYLRLLVELEPPLSGPPLSPDAQIPLEELIHKHISVVVQSLYGEVPPRHPVLHLSLIPNHRAIPHELEVPLELLKWERELGGAAVAVVGARVDQVD